MFVEKSWKKFRHWTLAIQSGLPKICLLVFHFWNR